MWRRGRLLKYAQLTQSTMVQRVLQLFPDLSDRTHAEAWLFPSTGASFALQNHAPSFIRPSNGRSFRIENKSTEGDECYVQHQFCSTRQPIQRSVGVHALPGHCRSRALVPDEGSESLLCIPNRARWFKAAPGGHTDPALD